MNAVPESREPEEDGGSLWQWLAIGVGFIGVLALYPNKKPVQHEEPAR